MLGELGSFVHLVVAVPKEHAASFLSDRLRVLSNQAGFEGWTFPVGIREPQVRMKIERYLQFDRRERMQSEHGVGWVRLYPRAVGSFSDVCVEVERFSRNV